MRTKEENLLLLALKEAAEGNNSISLPGSDPETEEKILRLAEDHAVLPIIFDALSTGLKDSTPGFYDMMRVKTRRTAFQNYRLLALSNYYLGVFKAAGIPVIFLKGIVVGMDYPAFEMRKSGDIDLLLPNRSDMDRAGRLMESIGAHASAVQHGNHHTAFIDPSTRIEIEIHTYLVEEFSDEGLMKRIRTVEESMYNDNAAMDIFGKEYPVLKSHEQGFYLLLHMLQHFMGTGFGLRLITDWVYFWNNRDDEEIIRNYRRLTDAAGLGKFSDLVTAASERAGLKKEIARRIYSEQYMNTTERKRDEMTDAFFTEIFAAQEFGNRDKSRMVVPKEKGFIGLFKEFHYQMKRNFKKASKIFLLWPFLYIATLFIFLRNNKTVRNTSVKDVISTAKKRKKLFDELDLAGE